MRLRTEFLRTALTNFTPNFKNLTKDCCIAIVFVRTLFCLKRFKRRLQGGRICIRIERSGWRAASTGVDVENHIWKWIKYSILCLLFFLLKNIFLLYLILLLKFWNNNFLFHNYIFSYVLICDLWKYAIIH